MEQLKLRKMKNAGFGIRSQALFLVKNDLFGKIITGIIFLYSLFFSTKSSAQDPIDGAYMNAYVVIADTGQNYFQLRTKMFNLAEKAGSEIDTMGRGFNPLKERITLPVDAEDEIYAGEYFPRRYPSTSLSLEYLGYYLPNGQMENTTIALVTTITSNKKEAEKALNVLKRYSKRAYLIRSRIYMGCIH